MATIGSFQARYVSGPDCAVTRNGKEAASQTYGQGAPLSLVAGLLTLVGDLNAINSLAGFAVEAATGTTSTERLYRPARAGDRYVMNLEDEGSAATLAQANVGVLVNFNVDTTNLKADIETSGAVITIPCGRIISLYDAVGDVNGRVIVELIDNPELGAETI